MLRVRLAIVESTCYHIFNCYHGREAPRQTRTQRWRGTASPCRGLRRTGRSSRRERCFAGSCGSLRPRRVLNLPHEGRLPLRVGPPVVPEAGREFALEGLVPPRVLRVRPQVVPEEDVADPEGTPVLDHVDVVAPRPVRVLPEEPTLGELRLELRDVLVAQAHDGTDAFPRVVEAPQAHEDVDHGLRREARHSRAPDVLDPRDVRADCGYDAPSLLLEFRGPSRVMVNDDDLARHGQLS